MSNHYHLLFETPEVGLSRGMKWLNQEYAERFNARHGRVGHLFQGRFKGILVERESHLLELVRYVVLNPVRCGAVQYAGDYEWSNYRSTAGLQSPPRWLEMNWTLDQFHPGDRAAAHELYRQFVADGRGAAYKPWERVVGQMFLGGAGFCDRMQQLVRSEARSREHPRRQREFVRPSFDAIVESVEVVFGTTGEQLKRKSRGPGRKALAHLALDEGGLTLRALAEWLGVSDWAVAKMRTRSRELYDSNRVYRACIERIRGALS